MSDLGLEPGATCGESAGDIPLRIDLAEDTWTSKDTTPFRTVSGRILSLKVAQDLEIDGPATLYAPSITILLKWTQLLTAGDIHAPEELSATTVEKLVRFVTICKTLASAASLARTGEPLALWNRMREEERIATFASWLEQRQPGPNMGWITMAVTVAEDTQLAAA
ncbi:hypothetical protein C8Q76DRAFT_794893 [Earliella scabrosa]|nr:hypothetical protein C8Q76DRAFT_794893 [Earliella scabrosa]